jgi:hypothetical protein
MLSRKDDISPSTRFLRASAELSFRLGACTICLDCLSALLDDARYFSSVPLQLLAEIHAKSRACA